MLFHRTQDPATPGTAPPGNASDQSSGVQAIVAAAAALAGLFTALRPTSAIAVALTTALPAVGGILPPLVAAIGTIVAAFSHPPQLVKRS